MAKKKEKLIILDLDDCIVSFLGGLCSLHNKVHGTCVHPNDIPDWAFDGLNMSDSAGNTVKGSDLRKTFKEYESEGFYAALLLHGDSDIALRDMKDSGHKVFILTARDEKFGKATEINLTFKQLASCVDKIIFKEDKVKEIQKLSEEYHITMFVDDKPETVNKVYKCCNVDHVFLVEHAFNKNAEIDPEIIRIRDIYETVRILKRNINKKQK